MTAEHAIQLESTPAPDLELVRDDGLSVRLSSLWAERPLVLAFFGDLANPFTSDNAAQLRDADEAFAKVDADIAAIVAARPERLATFREHWWLPYPLLSDPERKAFDAFGVNAAATFVIDPDGEIRFARHASNLADYPPTAMLLAPVCEITGATPPPPPPPSIAPSVDAPVAIEDGRFVPLQRYTCAKCGFSDCDRTDMATAGGFLSRIFNVQHRKFTAVSCRSCGYTELYRRDGGALGNVVDFLVGS